MGKINQPSDIINQLRDLRRKVTELGKRVGIAAAVISRGGLKIIDGGTFTLVDSNPTSPVQIVYFGPVTSGGQSAPGWILRNASGKLMFTLSGTPSGQFWSLRDSAERIIVSNDAGSGAGLATPWIPLPPLVRTDEFLTTSTSWTTVAVSYPFLQHPRITAWLTGIAGTGGSGEVRLLVNGTQVGSTIPFGSSGAITQIVGPVPGWGTSVTPMYSGSIELQARVTAAGSTGTVNVGCPCLYGIQS